MNMINCSFTISDYQIKKINKVFNKELNRDGTEEEIKILFESIANYMSEYVSDDQFGTIIFDDYRY